MADEIVIFVTASSKDEAETIAQRLVNEKLAACVNILPGVTSLFHWEGKVSKENETMMVIKSIAAQLDAIVKRVKEIHSYQAPEIIALPIVGGSQDYLNWLRDESSGRR